MVEHVRVDGEERLGFFFNRKPGAGNESRRPAWQAIVLPHQDPRPEIALIKKNYYTVIVL